MAYPISVRKNNYHEKPKNSTVYTPLPLCKQIYDIVTSSCLPEIETVLDPAIGTGNLTKYFYQNGCRVVGVDIERVKCKYISQRFIAKFETITDLEEPDLIVCNPPFNGASGRKLYPEVFLRHIETLFGSLIPVVMIVPMGFRLNQRIKSERWRYLKEKWKITSVMALPIDAFGDVLFHAEILFFNIPGIEATYWLETKDIKK